MARDDHDDPRDKGWAWVVALAVGIWNLLIAGTMKSFGLFYLEWLDLYRESPMITSLAGSIFSLLITIGAPISGIASDRYSFRTARKLVLVIGILISASFCAAGWMHSITGILVFYSFIPGILGAIVDTPILKLLSLYFKKRRSLANGIAFAGSSVGGLILPLLVGWANETYSVRGSLMLLGALWLNTLVVGAVMFPLPSTSSLDAIVREANEPSLAEDSQQEQGSPPEAEMICVESYEKVVVQPKSPNRKYCIQAFIDTVQFLRTPHLISLMLMALTASFACFNIFFVLPPFVTELGMSKITASWVLASISSIELVSRILVGLVADRLKRHKVWIPFVGLVVSLAAGLVVALIPSKNLIFAYIPFFGFFGGAFSPLIIPLMVELVPPDRIGSATGLYPLLVGTGSAIGIPMLGAMYEYTSSYQPCFLTCICMYAVATICIVVHVFRNVVFVSKSKT